MNRRTALLGIGATAFGIGGGFGLRSETSDIAMAAGRADKVVKTDAEWREILTPDQFAVLRKEATERAFSSPLDTEKRAGIFHCAGCDLDLYPSTTKYDSKTGWPSFYAPIAEDRIGTSTDYYLVYPRTEVHCARCEGHLGHIFDDGPKPTGKRHCLNGVALTFKAA
jgi:peptide-methionine (R)-S-oxide reductase